MDKGYKFGEIAVTCEGYDYPDDPYILQGSCGVRQCVCDVLQIFDYLQLQLEYKLERTSDYSAGGGSYDYGGQSYQPYRKQK